MVCLFNMYYVYKQKYIFFYMRFNLNLIFVWFFHCNFAGTHHGSFDLIHKIISPDFIIHRVVFMQTYFNLLLFYFRLATSRNKTSMVSYTLCTYLLYNKVQKLQNS